MIFSLYGSTPRGAAVFKTTTANHNKGTKTEKPMRTQTRYKQKGSCPGKRE